LPGDRPRPSKYVITAESGRKVDGLWLDIYSTRSSVLKIVSVDETGKGEVRKMRGRGVRRARSTGVEEGYDMDLKTRPQVDCAQHHQESPF